MTHRSWHSGIPECCLITKLQFSSNVTWGTPALPPPHLPSPVPYSLPLICFCYCHSSPRKLRRIGLWQSLRPSWLLCSCCCVLPYCGADIFIMHVSWTHWWERREEDGRGRGIVWCHVRKRRVHISRLRRRWIWWALVERQRGIPSVQIENRNKLTKNDKKYRNLWQKSAASFLIDFCF